MTIKCHYDGKVFIPDEPVELSAGEPATVTIADGAASVFFTGGAGGTVADLLNSGFIGAWGDRQDIADGVEYARDLRRRAEAWEDAADAGR